MRCFRLTTLCILFTSAPSHFSTHLPYHPLIHPPPPPSYPPTNTQVTERIRLKAATFGQDIAGTVVDPSSPPHYKVSPDEMADLYERWVMPMTKDVQVMYLLRRLDGGDHVPAS